MHARHLAPLLTAGALFSLAAAATAIPTTTRVSVATDGTPGNTGSSQPSVSADGRYIAFSSRASNLVDGDTNGSADVFVRDTVTGTTKLVSVATDGTQGFKGSDRPAISADGRFVAFRSLAYNLVADDSNGAPDIFVRDTVTNTTTRVSVATDGTQGDGECDQPSISADGRTVAFMSVAANLVADDTNSNWDVFVRDTVSGTTQRASVATDGTQATNYSVNPTISANGRYVAFCSYADALVSGDTNNSADVFVRDLLTGTTKLASIATDGTQADGNSDLPRMSADGRYVAFQSLATNLVSGDTNDTYDIFVRDTVTNTTARVSVAGDGAQAGDYSLNPAISADGRMVAFQSFATNLAPGDTNGGYDVFVRDTQAGTTQRLSVATDGTPGDGDSQNPSISPDGRYVAFDSYASALVPDDTNGVQDIFLRGPLTSISPAVMIPVGSPVKSSPTAFEGGVIFGADDGKLYGYDTSNGQPLSGLPVDVAAYFGAPVKIQSRPSAYYNALYPGVFFTTDRGDIMAFGPGGLGSFTPPVTGEGNTGTPAVMLDGTIYTGLSLGGMTGVLKIGSDAEVSITDTLGAGSISSVAVSGNRVYVGLTGGIAGDILVLNAADLTPLSSGVANGEGVTAPPYVVGQDMYVGTLAGNFYKLNSSNSSVDTSFGTGGKVAVGESLPTSAFYNNGAFYAGSTKGKVWKIGLDGTLSKTYDTWNPSAVVGGVVVERASNTLAFGTSAGGFYKVPLSGGDAGIFGPNLGFETTPTYDSSTGRFFIGSNDGNVYGF